MQSTLVSIREWHVILVIVIVGLVVYGKSIAYDYTYSDDYPLIVQNQKELSSFTNIPKFFRADAFLSVTGNHLFYRPLLDVLLMAEMMIGGTSPAIYHLTSILIHLGCCILIFKILQRLGTPQMVAALAAILFCVHPLNTSAVVWIPGCNDTLLTVYILSSFLFLLRAIESGKISQLVWHAALFFCAMLTKESAVVLPVLMIAFVLLLHPEIPRKTLWVSAGLCYLPTLAAWYLLRSSVPYTFNVYLRTGFVLESALHNLPGIFLYVSKIFFPFNLSIYPNLADNSVVAGVLAMPALLAAFWIWKPSSIRAVLWGLAWCCMLLVPTFVSNPLLFEHRAYSAFFGFLFAVAQFSPLQSVDVTRKSHIAVIAGLIIMFSIVAMVYSEQYRNRTTYGISAFRDSPSIDASYVNLAQVFIADGEIDDAERILRKGLERHSSLIVTHRLLGDILAHKHQYEDAAREYETALWLNPIQLDTYSAYAKMCLDAGWVEKACTLWKTSVRVNPFFISGYDFLANVYLHQKDDPDSAMIYIREIQKHGGTVMPELLSEIQAKKLHGKNPQQVQ